VILRDVETITEDAVRPAADAEEMEALVDLVDQAVRVGPRRTHGRFHRRREHHAPPLTTVTVTAAAATN
jgi:hypothetical protein